MSNHNKYNKWLAIEFSLLCETDSCSMLLTIINNITLNNSVFVDSISRRGLLWFRFRFRFHFVLVYIIPVLAASRDWTLQIWHFANFSHAAVGHLVDYFQFLSVESWAERFFVFHFVFWYFVAEFIFVLSLWICVFCVWHSAQYFL